MSKASHFSTSIKICYAVHWFLTILSVGGIFYLVFSLHETKNELKQLKESCTLCNVQNTNVESESDTIWSKFERILSEGGKEASNMEEGGRGRTRRAPATTPATKPRKNETCENLIANFMKLLKVTSRLVCINSDCMLFERQNISRDRLTT